MVFNAEMAASLQPWYRMSLPPRSWKAFRLGSVALRLPACLSSAVLTPVSKLKVLKSQAGSSKTMLGKKLVVNWNIRLFPGAAPLTQEAQPPGPSSPPGTRPGKIFSPLELLGPAYNFLRAATCGAVRQLSESASLHSMAAGSKRHSLGSLITPSVTPS